MIKAQKKLTSNLVTMVEHIYVDLECVSDDITEVHTDGYAIDTINLAYLDDTIRRLQELRTLIKDNL